MGHVPNDKYKNPWESMKPVTMHPTGPNCFCLGVGGFLNFGVPNVFHMVKINPFHQVLNCYLLRSQFIPQVPNVFPITLHFLSFFPLKKNSIFFNGTNGKIHCKTEPVQDERKSRGEYPTSPTKKHITT
jgi:hypothetical protein